jgi:SIR2-like domain
VPDRYYQPKSTILLTGAGFSKPFGGYLASEMWSIIFNQLNSSDAQRLRGLLLGELNYERAYDLVMNGAGDFGPTEQLAFTNALMAAYSELDRSIRVHLMNESGRIQPLHHFIERFAGKGKERGFVFTLNQDVLLERFASHGNGLFQIPALNHHDWFSGRLKSQEYPETDISNPLEFEKVSTNFWGKGTGLDNFLYMKLHGSYGWKSSKYGKPMVIGYDKAGSIAKEPLLKWYLDIFTEVLSTKNITLVVVGYGFMDRHINELIFKAAGTGLQLHVVSPMQPKDFRNHLQSVGAIAGIVPVPYGHEIWQMLRGYHCTSVEEMVPPNGSALPGAAFFEQVGL